MLPRRPRGVIAIRSDAVAAGVGNALLIGVGVCGLIVALLVVVVRGGDGSLSSDPVGSVNDVFVGVAWIAAGIACWWRVRGSPTGPLMVSTGFAWWPTA